MVMLKIFIHAINKLLINIISNIEQGISNDEGWNRFRMPLQGTSERVALSLYMN